MSAEPFSKQEIEAMIALGPSALRDRWLATVETKLADCERRERAAVERAEALRRGIGIISRRIDTMIIEYRAEGLMPERIEWHMDALARAAEKTLGADERRREEH